jgi:phosphoribosylformylglycinamidine synthase
MNFDVLVEVRLRRGIADPQGATIERALPALGFNGVRDVTVGKAIRFIVEAPDETAARTRVDELCQRFLTNPVIEDALTTVSVASAAASAAAASAAAASETRR